MTPQRVTFAVIFLLWLGIFALIVVYTHGDPSMVAMAVLAGIFVFGALSRMAKPQRVAPRRTQMPLTYATAAAKIDAIEAEMKRLGFWQDTPLKPEQYDFRAAFAGDTMAFPQWLQFIFVPNVRAIIAQKGAFPASSQVGTYAVREFDTSAEDTSSLTHLLIEFDKLF